MCHRIWTIIGLVLLSSCLPDQSKSDDNLEIPTTGISLPEALNIRENILEMRGLTADFTEASWEEAGLDAHHGFQSGNGYYIIGKLQPTPENVQALLILEDRPQQSTAWVVTYHKQKLSDFIEVFNKTPGQVRTVGSNWRSGQLYISLNKGSEQYEETFLIDAGGKLTPYTPKKVPQ